VKVDVVELYSDASEEEMRGATAVVIDILRATTSIAHFLVTGARAVIPVAGHEAGFRLRDELVGEGSAGGSVVLAGESSGLRVEGFDFGNSPVEIDGRDFTGTTVILSTTNGTLALHHCRDAERTYASAFNNAPAVARRILQEGAERVILACSGDSGRFSPEDHWGAGCLAEALVEGGAAPGAGAEEALSAWREVQGDLCGALREAPHGKDLISLGLGADLAAAAMIGSHDVVPVMLASEIVPG